jgi:hypothetical protein
MMEQTGARKHSVGRIMIHCFSYEQGNKAETEKENRDMRMVTTYLGPEDTLREGGGESSFHIHVPRYGTLSVTCDGKKVTGLKQMKRN